jgi:structure-specific recognition protein 1
MAISFRGSSKISLGMMLIFPSLLHSLSLFLFYILVSIRFYIPPEPDFENKDRETPSNAELFQQRIMKNASIKNTSGDVIVEFPETRGTFLTPRGRYTIELYETFMRMRGNKYDYKIRYDDISRLFLLPKPDDVHMAFVIALDKPIRQGQQRYQYLVLQTNKEQEEVTVNLDEETLQKEYNGDLQPVMTGSFSNLVAKTFKVIAKKKVFIPGKFANANQQACVKCALRANEGLLYPLEKQFLFIHKPPVLIRFDEVESVEFQRYAGGQGSTRNFDLCVALKSSSVAGGGAKEYTFSGIDRTDYTGLYNFLSGKKIVIKNLEGASEEKGSSAPVYNENEIYGFDAEDAEESEDEDFDENENDEDESEDIDDDDDLGSEIDNDLDSDIEEARKKSGGKKTTETNVPKKKRKAPTEEEDDDDGDDHASEQKPKKKKKMTPTSPTSKKSNKKKKDPNAPKKPQTAYFLFMNKNRAAFKEKYPDASFGDLVSAVMCGIYPAMDSDCY